MIFTKNTRLSALMALLSISYFTQTSQAANMFGIGSESDPVQDSLNAIRPVLEFPDTFEVSISSNDPGLNITEVIYFDKS